MLTQLTIFQDRYYYCRVRETEAHKSLIMEVTQVVGGREPGF